MTHIRGKSCRRNNTPEALAARLPRDLRRFDNWQYSEDGRATGLAAYLHALTAWIADQHGTPVDVNVAPLVMREAGLDVADLVLGGHVDYVMIRF